MNLILRLATGVLCLCSICATVCAEDAGTLILDESSYCRSYYRFDVQKIAPSALKAEGEKVLGAGLLLALLGSTLMGCNGGFLRPPSTPPGSFPVLITGTSGTTVQSTTVTVVVQ